MNTTSTSTDLVVAPTDAASGAGALVLAAGARITPEEQERRIKEAEELEKKLDYIQHHVPSKIQNVSGSSAGAGSGDFHQYRMVRRHEQMRLKRMDEAWQKEQQQAEFEKKQKERQEAAEQRTAKRRAKRQKKKGKKKAKPQGADGAAAEGQAASDGSSSGSEPEQAALD